MLIISGGTYVFDRPRRIGTRYPSSVINDDHNYSSGIHLTVVWRSQTLVVKEVIAMAVVAQESPAKPVSMHRRVLDWLMYIEHTTPEEHQTHHWLVVMCLTGVDYFSTLGYQPGIAALAAGQLSPIATIILVLITLFGALPIYRRVAEKSPHGEGSIAMIEKLTTGWQSKLLVLILLGFMAVDFFITITLSVSDAAAHMMENPLVPQVIKHPIILSVLMIVMLGIIFMRSFKEAMDWAMRFVIFYLSMNFIVIGWGIWQLALQPELFINWQTALLSSHGGDFGTALALIFLGAALTFPKLALGLSGFETGVGVMRLVRGDPTDTEKNPVGRIRNTKKLLTMAAVIMSCYLITSSFVTTLLIPADQFQPGGEANGRALAFLAYEFFGPVFGALYDLATLLILGFAGASAMAGLLNIVPRYLPRYGMAPEWAKSTRSLAAVFTVISIVIVLIFQADVDAQGGAYATGVLVLMTSGCVAVMLAALAPRRKVADGTTTKLRMNRFIGIQILVARLWNSSIVLKMRMALRAVPSNNAVLKVRNALSTLITALRLTVRTLTGLLRFSAKLIIMVWRFLLRFRSTQSWAFGLITLVFIYTTLMNMHERPDGLKIAFWFIVAIIVTSFISRWVRSTELRITDVRITCRAARYLGLACMNGNIKIVALRQGDPTEEYLDAKLARTRVVHNIRHDKVVVFVHFSKVDSSEFESELEIDGRMVGSHIYLHGCCQSIPNALAAFAIYLRHVHPTKTVRLNFFWTKGSQLWKAVRYVVWGEGEISETVEEILWNATPEDMEGDNIVVYAAGSGGSYRRSRNGKNGKAVQHPTA